MSTAESRSFARPISRLHHGFIAAEATIQAHARRGQSLFFRTLARATIRHNRAVLAIWIIVLAVSVPPILQVQRLIVYSETAFNSTSSESSLAQQIDNREFKLQAASRLV